MLYYPTVSQGKPGEIPGLFVKDWGFAFWGRECSTPQHETETGASVSVHEHLTCLDFRYNVPLK